MVWLLTATLLLVLVTVASINLHVEATPLRLYSPTPYAQAFWRSVSEYEPMEYAYVPIKPLVHIVGAPRLDIDFVFDVDEPLQLPPQGYEEPESSQSSGEGGREEHGEGNDAVDDSSSPPSGPGRGRSTLHDLWEDQLTIAERLKASYEHFYKTPQSYSHPLDKYKDSSKYRYNHELRTVYKKLRRKLEEGDFYGLQQKYDKFKVKGEKDKGWNKLTVWF